MDFGGRQLQMVLKTLVYLPFNHMMQLLAREYFTKHIYDSDLRVVQDSGGT
jgi:hypothetical protein